MPHKGELGASTNVEKTPERRKRDARRRRRQEKAWQAKNGPVTVRYVDPAELRKPDS